MVLNQITKSLLVDALRARSFRHLGVRFAYRLNTLIAHTLHVLEDALELRIFYTQLLCVDTDLMFEQPMDIRVFSQIVRDDVDLLGFGVIESFGSSVDTGLRPGRDFNRWLTGTISISQMLC